MGERKRRAKAIADGVFKEPYRDGQLTEYHDCYLHTPDHRRIKPVKAKLIIKKKRKR